MASKFKCAICLNNLTKPKILPCFHSFCLECLEQLHDVHKMDITCPTCRKPVNVPYGGVKMFQDNFYIEDVCPGSCCEKHPDESIKLVCKDCDDRLMCLVCKPTKHENHKCEDVATEAEEKRKLVVEKLEKTENCLKDTISKSEECCSKEDKEYKLIELEAKECKENLRKLKKQFDTLSSSIEGEIDRQASLYKAKRQLARNVRKQAISEFEESIERCRSQLEHNENVILLRNYKDMLQTLSSVIPINCHTTGIHDVRASVATFRMWLKDLRAANDKIKFKFRIPYGIS